jgi:hypothetical protein
VAGTGLIAIGASGYLFNPIGWLRRGLAILAGIFLVIPITTIGGLSFMINLMGVVLGGFVLLPEYRYWLANRRLKRAKLTMED